MEDDYIHIPIIRLLGILKNIRRAGSAAEGYKSFFEGAMIDVNAQHEELADTFYAAFAELENKEEAKEEEREERMLKHEENMVRDSVTNIYQDHSTCNSGGEVKMVSIEGSTDKNKK